MSLYFFHLHDGDDILVDPEGRELTNAAAVSDEALKEARALISAEALEGRIDLSLRLHVEDIGRALIHLLVFADAIEIIHPIAGQVPPARP